MVLPQEFQWFASVSVLLAHVAMHTHKYTSSQDMLHDYKTIFHPFSVIDKTTSVILRRNIQSWYWKCSKKFKWNLMVHYAYMYFTDNVAQIMEITDVQLKTILMKESRFTFHINFISTASVLLMNSLESWKPHSTHTQLNA